MTILITSGATREPIDDVRFLTNVSTGGTGATIAEALAARGHAVTVLRGEGAVTPRDVETVLTFGSTADLQGQLREQLGTGRFDVVIMCAAVSDYRPDTVTDGKLTSYADELILRLVPTPKLLPALKSHAPNPAALTVVGFKLTSGADTDARADAVAKLFAAGTVDLVIQNDLREMAASGDARPFRAWRAGNPAPEALAGVEALIDWLDSTLAPAGKTR
ncbi:MAG: phosphopantothenoylcysteine decarboxylase [Verrucomicrobiota bacterium]